MDSIVPGVELLDGSESQSLLNIALFEQIKEKLNRQQGLRHKNNGAHLRGQIGLREGTVNNESEDENQGDEAPYIPPLSAYSATSDEPYLPLRSIKKGCFKVSIAAMKYDDFERRMYQIRKTGWHTLKPIGVAKTMAEIRREQRHKKEGSSNPESSQPETATEPDVDMLHQENINVAYTATSNRAYSNNTDVGAAIQNQERVLETSVEPQNRDNSFSVQGIGQDVNEGEEEEDEEDEISYDYDAEFARVEVEDEESDFQNRSNFFDSSNISDLNHGVTAGINDNEATGGLSIQQFVETTAPNQNPYDDVYDESESNTRRVHLDPDESIDRISSDFVSDNQEFTEMPTVDISDTINESDIMRSSRVSSLQNQQQ